jgi:hypothetical protein
LRCGSVERCKRSRRRRESNSCCPALRICTSSPNTSPWSRAWCDGEPRAVTLLLCVCVREGMPTRMHVCPEHNVARQQLLAVAHDTPTRAHLVRCVARLRVCILIRAQATENDETATCSLARVSRLTIERTDGGDASRGCAALSTPVAHAVRCRVVDGWRACSKQQSSRCVAWRVCGCHCAVSALCERVSLTLRGATETGVVRDMCGAHQQRAAGVALGKKCIRGAHSACTGGHQPPLACCTWQASARHRRRSST